jgi:predicted O-methyltransferase YrrM
MWEAFNTEFAPHLAHTPRWEAFQLIADKLRSIDAPVQIVETGTLRSAGNWAGDGQSTALFGWITEQCGGSITTIDISEHNLAVAKRVVPHAITICADSVVALRQLERPQDIDLLYLDSFDLEEGIESPTHQLAEIAAIYPRLKSGCIIASDDCFDEHNYGKHVLTKAYLQAVGAETLHQSQIYVWQKP